MDNVINYEFAKQYNDYPGLPSDQMVLHEDFQVYDLEANLDYRRRFRSLFETQYIPEFIRRVNDHLQTEHSKSAGFINIGSGDKLTAQVVFNLGNQDQAGHGDDRANITLRRTAEFEALLGMLDDEHSQRDFVEHLEDWAEHLTPGRISPEGEPLTFGIGVAIQAVRNIKVTEKRESTHVEGELSRERGSLDQITADGVLQNLPTYLVFTGALFEGLPEQEIKVRVQLKMENGEKPRFILKAVKLQKHYEVAGREFAKRLELEINNVPMYLGTNALVK